MKLKMMKFFTSIERRLLLKKKEKGKKKKIKLKYYIYFS